MPRLITLDDIDDLATGSAFLGTGGGGDPFIGSLLCKEAIAAHGPVTLLSLDELSDDDGVFVVAALGAPTVMIEKLFSVEDANRSVSALEQRLNRKATAIISAEIGGLNSVMPVAFAAARGLPIVDGDGMGRAFPSIDMTTFNVYGVSCTPMTVSDEHGNVVTFDTATAKTAEDLCRPLVATMGAAANLSCYPMTGAEAKRAAMPATVSAALTIGAAIRAAGSDVPPVDRLLAALHELPYYRNARCLFQGKITDIRRDTTRGWVFGRCVMRTLDEASEAIVGFQNENIAVHVDGVMRAVVPDLVCIVDSETAEPIPTESLRYGQRVSVIACSAPPALRTPEALRVMGPAAFGLTEDYASIEELAAI